MKFANESIAPNDSAVVMPPDSESLFRSKTRTEIIDTYDELIFFIGNNGSDITEKQPFIVFEDKIFETCDSLRDLVLIGAGEKISELDTLALRKFYKNKYLIENNIHLRSHRSHEKVIITSKGELKIERHVLRPSSSVDLELLQNLTGKKTVAPLDNYLRINDLPFKITPKAMLKIAYCCASELSYNAAIIRLREDNNIDISGETARNVTDYIGNLVHQNDVDYAENVFLNRSNITFQRNKDNVLYIMPDGSMIHTRDKDEQGHRWHENKLGVVFSSDNMRLKGVSKGIKNYEIMKKEYTNFFGSVPLFQKMLFATAINNGYGNYLKTVIISDGASWISNMKDLLFPDAIHILDFWHATEYIYELAKIYFKNESEKYKPWVDNIKEQLLDSNHEVIINEIMDKESKLSVKRKIYTNKDGFKYNVGKCSKYLISNKNRMDYKKYKELGLYIGSGHIESGNKSVAQERLKRPGMMWNIKSAQNLLSLRAKLKSDLWYKVELIVMMHFKMIKY